MKIYTEISLSNFEFWSGAKDTARYISDLSEINGYENVWDVLEDYISECYGNGIDETTLNDLFWFDNDVIAGWFFFNDFEELMDFVDNVGENKNEDESDFDDFCSQYSACNDCPFSDYLTMTDCISEYGKMVLIHKEEFENENHSAFFNSWLKEFLKEKES